MTELVLEEKNIKTLKRIVKKNKHNNNIFIKFKYNNKLYSKPSKKIEKYNKYLEVIETFNIKDRKKESPIFTTTYAITLIKI